MDESKDGNGEITKVTWRIQNFSSFKKHRKLYSENFTVDGNKWRILIFPKGNNVRHLSIYLDVADSAILPSGWSRFAQFGFAVIDQIDPTNSITEVQEHVFNARQSDWGFSSFLAHSELENPKRGYLLNDACLVEAYISTDRTEGLISHELMVENNSNKDKTKEADRVKAAIGNQKTTTTKPVGITTPSPTQPSCHIEAIELEEPTKEDMNTFFTSLEYELSSSDIVYSQEKAKEALSKLIDEALDMTPVNFYYSGKFSPLQQAFKILASFDCSSTTLTIAQQNELMTMGESLKELSDRASKAVQEKTRFSAKESIKLTITQNLDRNTTRYKEVISEVKQVEQKLSSLLAEQKDIFRSSKRMKMELEALGKEWAEYEANAKAAEEEEKSVEAEWGRMKDLMSFIKGMI
ncbi:hypothetical protein HRI_001721100 [Hibiscus trionum]|uniref:MATH domain-containing protein n=1 Tax=Hibiscus trionum TaxID=183268 RepID=A0A9W7HN96_HIBTR|nr:hypothetical protein HRI_001721100 [Hibiscus trionum]